MTKKIVISSALFIWAIVLLLYFLKIPTSSYPTALDIGILMNPNPTRANPTVSPTPYINHDPLVDTLASYTVPSGWKKYIHADENSNYVDLTSPDFKGELAAEKGARIRISRFKTEDPQKFISSIQNDTLTYQKDKKLTQINGYTVFSLHEDYEGHHQQYMFIQGSYIWDISITTPSIEIESTYRGTIDSFVNSIHFK